MSDRLIVGDCIDVMRELEAESIDAIVSDPPYGLEFMGEAWDAPWKDAAIVRDPAAEGGAQDGGDGNAYSRAHVRYQGIDRRLEAARAGEMTEATAKYVQHAVTYDRDPHRLQAWHAAWLAEALRVLKPGGWLIAMSGTRTYHRLACAAEDVGFEIRDMVEWLYGSGFPKSHNLRGPDGEKDGRGTALKPSHEPAVLARKPFRGSVAANVDRHGTGALNIDACRFGYGDPMWPGPNDRDLSSPKKSI